MSLLTWLRSLVNHPAPPPAPVPPPAPRTRAPFPRGACPTCGKSLALHRDGVTPRKHRCGRDYIVPVGTIHIERPFPLGSDDTLTGSTRRAIDIQIVDAPLSGITLAGDGVTDDTTAVQAALDAGRRDKGDPVQRPDTPTGSDPEAA